MQSFLAACGLTEPIQLVVERPGAAGGDDLRLMHQPFAIIGRDSRADLVLDHTRVSRRHVYFQVIGGWPFWVDLESRTGTRVDGITRKHGWLIRGRGALSIGPYVVRGITETVSAGRDPFRAEPLPTVPFIAPGYGDAPLPEVALEFLNGPSRATTWPVRRVMSFIGSAVGCKFRLTDASVSRFHASFLRTSGGLWIVDLLGQGGITVNEVPVRFSQLTDGDLLTIGRYQIRVSCRFGRQNSTSGLPDRIRAKDTGQPYLRAHVFNRHESTAELPVVTVPFRPGSEPPGQVSQVQYPLPIPAFPTEMSSEIIASEGILPALKLVPPELAESVLVPLVSQFGVMQQQMFDQFQQAMAMMLQMFGTMHREQMDVIRGELDQLRDLTEEFQSLKMELTIRTQNGAETLASSADAIAQRVEQAVVTKLSAMAATETLQEARKVEPAPERAGASQFSSPASTTSGSQSSSARTEANRPEGPSAAPQEKLSGTLPPTDAERDSVVWLHQRIMSLQRERETRWQKILKLLPGVS